MLPHWLGFAFATWTGAFYACANARLDYHALGRAAYLRLGAYLALGPTLLSVVQLLLPGRTATTSTGTSRGTA